MNQGALFEHERQPFNPRLPEWLFARYEDVGRLGRPIREAAVLRPCDRCKRPVLTAEDQNWCGVTKLTVDPVLLDDRQELGAILSGRVTALLRIGLTGISLATRDHYSEIVPASRSAGIVVPEHQCRDPVRGWALPWNMLYPTTYRRHTEDPNDSPPF